MKNKFLLTMAIALLLTACGKDDDGGGGEEENARTPITFTANIQPEKTRVTVNNGWTALSDNRMAIKIDGVTKTYTVSEIGEVTSDDPFYWDERESVAVEAWYPFCDGVKPETFTVRADQSIPENYEKSDYLEVAGTGASPSTVTAKRSTLTFTHRTTKLSCNISSIYGDTKGARVTFHKLSGVDEGTSVKATNKHRALIVPQTIPVGTEFLEVAFSDGSRYVHTLDEELVLNKGFQVQAAVSITETGIDVVYSQLISWVVDEETPDGQSPGTNPGSNGDGWTGGSEDTDGSSPGTNPNGSTSGWTGDSEDTNGNSSEANPTNGNNGNWTGSQEDANGTTPEANPNNGNGSWSANVEEANGNSPNVTPGNGNGSWTGSSEDATAGNTVIPDWDWPTTP